MSTNHCSLPSKINVLYVGKKYEKPALGSRRKNDTVPAWELFFMNTAPAPEHLVFVSAAPELSFFMAPVPAPAFVHFHRYFQLSCCASS